MILLADDLGWTDVTFHGGNIPTPNIDRIAAEGAELARYYVAPVCSPTRAGLLTGRYPIRYGAMRSVYPPWRDGGMDVSELTIADVLAEAGYRHRAVFGKWHLGHSDKQYHPLRRGFTEFYGHYNGAVDYFTHEREGEVDWHEGFEPSDDQGYATDLIADRAARFVRSHAAAAEPFLCYVPFGAPHSPFQAKQEHLPLYAGLPPARGFFQGLPGAGPGTAAGARHESRKILGAMVHSLDQGVGKILDAIDQSGIAADTFVLFSSDNGGVAGIGENTPLRGAKASVFEGGIRVAAAVRWPGRIPLGRRIRAPLANIDILPTVMRMAGVERFHGKPLDGLDILDVLTGRQQSLERDLFNYVGQSGARSEQVSYMTNDWKLVVVGPDVTDETADDALRKRFLFRISDDPSEERNLLGEHRELADSMYSKIKQFRALQPAGAVAPYRWGRGGFQAPPRWEMAGE
ncbi:MAG: sulfatase-like hydrolase/transferase [Bryobacterales bacterium]|nr:sulfatase-like hydrolase/transferase [Bryobacterales bacterium]